MTKWEYLIVNAEATAFTTRIDLEKLQQHISALGDEGWELVGTSDRNRNGNTRDVILYLKRPKA